LRREATASSPIALVRLLGLGEAGDLATAVLEGRDLADDARAEASEASSWSWRALASVVSRGEMSAEEVPWISIVYALWLILLVPLAVENVFDWAGATLDGWDVAQLVGCAISIPVSLVALVRVVFWMRLRRRSIP
jgi:hypothetical protein